MTSVSFEVRMAAIRSAVSIFDLLDRFDIPYPHGRSTQQIACPFHTDRRPSARVYYDTNKVFCFTCNKTWDQIAFMKQQLNVDSYGPVVEWFESHFSIPSPTDNLNLALQAQLQAGRQPQTSLAELYDYVEALLINARKRMTLEQYVNRLYALDVIAFKRSTNEMKPEDAREKLQQLVQRIQNL